MSAGAALFERPAQPAPVLGRPWWGGGRTPRLDPRARGRIFVGLAVLGALVAGGLLTLSPILALVALAVVGLVAWVWVRPQVAAYVVIFCTPLVAGINRGSVIPLLRPNEAIDLVVGGVLFARGVFGVRTGQMPRLKLDTLEWTLVAMAVASSIVPLLWMYVRSVHPTSDDLQYSLVLWKFFGLYLLVRFSIRTSEQVLVALWLGMASCAIVCGVAILQALNLFGVPHLLSAYFAPYGVDGALTIERGSSLLSLPAAVADLAILNLAVVVGMLLLGMGNRLVLAGLGLLFLLGVISAAEFSSVLALLVAAVALSFIVGAGRVIKFGVPSLVIGGYALKSVVGTRLLGFSSSTGLPVSWVGRLNNLRTYFWPTLSSGWNWVLGVRPAARVPVASQAFGYVWIESGYTWLLWGGGIPLLASYFAFIWVAMRRAWRLATQSGPVAVAAVAVFALLASQVVVMLFDPHLTYRGSADALFAMLALARPQLLGARKAQPEFAEVRP